MENLNVDGYCDLNIHYKASDQLLSRVIEFKYRAVALNRTVDVSKINSNTLPKKKGKPTTTEMDKSLEIFPTDLADAFQSVLSKFHQKLKVFLRITIIFETTDQLKFVLNNPNVKKYDIISVLPLNNAAYQHACTNPVIDLISFQVGITNYKPSGKMHKQLVERSGYFEIIYGQALKSSASRQETFTMTQYFFIYGKSRNAIISSGAQHYLELRNPYDVANLGILFGLSEERAKCSISRNCHLLLLAAGGRRYGKTAITVEVISKDEEPNKKRLKL